MRRQFLLERECIHRDHGLDGDTYNGMFFVQALQRLQSAEALKMAAKVTPFYWVDAPRVLICTVSAPAASIRSASALVSISPSITPIPSCPRSRSIVRSSKVVLPAPGELITLMVRMPRSASSC